MTNTSLSLQVDHWNYLHTGPLFSGSFKQELSDFKVTEALSFIPTNSGEHTLIELEKTGLNTAFVAEQMAKFGQLPLRAISYAGRKDKYASTRQWFGVYHGGKQKPDWNRFSLEGTKILQIVQNERKLRTGAISKNSFDIILRNITDVSEAALNQRIEEIKQHGVPNYFGNQRFGEIIKHDGTVQLGGNLSLAEKLVNGEIIRNRNKNSMAISALRSWLFNHFVSNRISKLPRQHLLDGDALSLAGTNSFFIHHQQDELTNTKARIASTDIHITAPLWGQGSLDSQSQAHEFEMQTAAEYPIVCKTLESLGLKQQRRPVLVFVQDFTAEISDNCAHLSFSLPAGCFATSVLREIVKVSVGGNRQTKS